MKHIVMILVCLLGLLNQQGQMPEYDGSKENEVYESLSNVGKSLTTMRSEYPEGEVFVQPGGLPDAALVCFGEADSNIGYVLFGTQGLDHQMAAETYGDNVVWVNTNTLDESGWTYTGCKEIKAEAPTVIMNEEMEKANLLFLEGF